jgi:hypothetical protein
VGGGRLAGLFDGGVVGMPLIELPDGDQIEWPNCAVPDCENLTVMGRSDKCWPHTYGYTWTETGEGDD